MFALSFEISWNFDQISPLKGKFPQTMMRIMQVESNFRNPTVTF